MKTSIIMFASDLADEGIDTVLDNVQHRAGLDGISVAANYHHARDVFPHNPTGAVKYQDAEVFVRVRPERYGRLRPQVHPLAAEHDLYAQVCERTAGRGLDVRAWLNITHNSRLGAAHPDCAVQNLFGDSYRSNLCPANPHVRAYARALCADAARYSFSCVFAESVGYLPFDHGDHHERCHTPLGAVPKFVLGLCFCPHCSAAAKAEGVAVEAVREQLRNEVEKVFRGEPSAMDDVALDRTGAGGLAGGELAGMLRARTRAVTELVGQIVEGIQSESQIPFQFMDISGGLQAAGSGIQVAAGGAPALDRAWQDGVDLGEIVPLVAGVSGLAYVEEPAALAAEVAAYREEVPHGSTLAVAIRPMPPDCHDPENLRTKVAAARDVGVDQVDFYHYGFAPLASLDWIRQALATEPSPRQSTAATIPRQTSHRDRELTGMAGIITGGGSGIGAATARRLAGEGARVLVVDLRAEAAEAVAKEIRAGDGAAHGIECDIRAWEEVTRARDECLRRWGRLDFVVANAGVGDSDPVSDGDPERWQKVVETNVLGTILTVRAALESMAGSGGDIVIVASLSGRVAYAGESVYIASKWASVGFGHSLRLEAQQAGVRVTLVEPGLVDTPLARANAYATPLFDRFQPLCPEDVADVIVYSLTRPAHVLVREVALQPTKQEL